MNGFTHRWLAPDPGDEAAALRARKPTSGASPSAVEPLVERLLWSRGYRDDSAAATFRDASLKDLHDPSLLPGVDDAASRLLSALRDGETVVVYGDYDVDGMSASAILYHTCLAIAPNNPVRTYVPHRIDDGYGLHAGALEQMAREGVKLVISVDCGVTALEPARAAKAAGLSLIITDHHSALPDGRLPDCAGIVHPRLGSPAYPYPDLCGAGVAFKLAWRLMTMASGSAKLSEPLRNVLLDCLALAALGTVADIVPLVGENRVIARHGLRRLRHTAIPGLKALIEESGLAGENIDAERVGFTLGPRLNACGRLGHAKHAVAMLTTATPDEARTIARELASLNEARRKTERAIFDEALQLAHDAGMTSDDRRAIVLAGKGWHAGVVGIVCSRLIGRHYRPTILLEDREGVCHGSGRSIDGFSLIDGLQACAPHLTKFGGHEMAAGLSLPSANMPAFVEAFTDYANSKLTPASLTPSLAIDCTAHLHELTPRAVRQLQDLGPFGRGNPAPRLLLGGMRVARPAQSMGAGGKHLSVFVAQGDAQIRLVGWDWGSRRELLRGGASIDAVVEPAVSTWNGTNRVEATIVDLRII
jgi:single-stranded-DNA-specific exonuclease